MDNNNEKNLSEQDVINETEASVEAAEETVEEVVEEAAAEAVEAPQLPEEPQKPRKTKTGKWKLGGQTALMSAAFIAIIVVINILVGVLTARFPSMNIDLTAEKRNTLSDQALKIAKGVDRETKIYLIGAEEKYRKDQIYSNYSLEFSQVANLAEKLQEANSKISVEFVDPDLNPTFISSYSEENLFTGCTVVKTDKRYRVLHPTDLFDVTSASAYSSSYETYSMADSALAAALETVNMEKVPVITVATGHGEMLTSSMRKSFETMLEEQNFEIREIDFLTEEIPEETQIVMIPTPSTDYTAEEIDKLRAFLDDETREDQLSLLVTFHASQTKLPKLESFLEEWGIEVESGMLAETDTSRMMASNPGYLIVDPNQEDVLPEGTYTNLVVAACRPLTVLFKGNLNISTTTLWETADSAYIFTDEMKEIPDDPDTDSYVAAAIGARYAKVGHDSIRRSVIVFGSSYVFTDTFINATAYGDKTYIRDLLQYFTNTDASSVSVSQKKVQTNVLDISAPRGTINFLGLGVFTIGLPVAILILGLVIFLRRRHL